MKLRTILLFLVVLALIGGGIYWSLQNVFNQTQNSTSTAQQSGQTTSGSQTQASSQTTSGTQSDSQTQSANDQNTSANPANPLTAHAAFINNLTPNSDTPKNYRTPNYDPFNNKYGSKEAYEEQIKAASSTQPDVPPIADFSFSANRKGLASPDSGTAGTEFEFNANASEDKETENSKLQVRWDFESDGKPDTYFSQTKSALHTYKEAGIYSVTLEVLDTAGNVSKISKQVTIVNNTNPVAFFNFTPVTGTTNTIIEFRTGNSYDSQYVKDYLEYRFDWDGDGKWDTKYDSKTVWKHKFANAGTNHVIMEVKDPEGLTDTAHADLVITTNTPPTASFTVKKNTSSLYSDNYIFDASASSDTETAKNKLQFRWDFNYTGADDIAFDTQYSTSPKHSGTYKIPGEKTIRLQVKDQDGVVSEAFNKITVEESK
jgi:PKD repeat protein